jgi:hypothetical protein
MLELFLDKENLLPDAENKWLTTVNTGQGFVTVLHTSHFLAAAQSDSKARVTLSARPDASAAPFYYFDCYPAWLAMNN